MPRVETRRVLRHFALGKGFGRKQDAYIHIAKRELGEASTAHGDSLESFKEFFIQKFPRDCPEECPLAERCRCYFDKAEEVEDYIPDPEDPFGDVKPVRWVKEPRSVYCNRKRWDYLRARARELAAEDAEGGSK